MFATQSFNNLLNGNSFNRIFADTPTPTDPVIDLSSGCEAEDFDGQNSLTGRKRQHTSDVASFAKRKVHESIISESQKNRNRNMPLKKRGTGNREEELSFLNLLANENSNQAQNLVKVERANGSTTCDSSSSGLNLNRFLSRQPKDEIVCDCFNCFPVLGSKGSTKCKKIRKVEESGGSSSGIDPSMIPGPSGLQQSRNIQPPAKKRNYYESDSDDSDDQIEIPEPPAILIEDESIETKNVALAAPDLQLDWLSDSSPEEDDDVIFVSDRAAPIDLTADSDTDNAPSPADVVSIDRILHGSTIDNPITNVSNSSAVQSASTSSRYVEPYYCLQMSPTPSVHRAHPLTVNAQRAPIMASSVSTQNSVTVSTPPRVIINVPTPPLQAPAPHRVNYHSMITGSDVMLYDGQTYMPRFMRDSSSNPPAEPDRIEVVPTRVTAPRVRIQNQSSADLPTRRTYNLPTTTNYYRPPSPIFQRNIPPPPTEPVVPPTAHQNCRQHVGRCPFMTEGHHYNRPRRFSRDFYSMSNGRPYAVHEDLWRRQYQEQEIRRHYWSPSFNDNAPEVQLLRPPPASPYFGVEPFSGPNRLVTALSDNNNNNPCNNVTNPTDSLRSYDRQRTLLSQPNAHTRSRRPAPW